MKKTASNCVYLDFTRMSASHIKARFPHIFSTCRFYGLRIEKDLIPVRPAAHYWMGGIRTDLNGQTSVRNLYACGEAACTGLHGANRLASNSLLEGLVMGARVGNRILETVRQGKRRRIPCVRYQFPQRADIHIDREDLKRSVRSLMWRNVGIIRSAEGLEEAAERFQNWESYAFRKEFREPAGFESQNMLILAGLTAKSALARRESRGAHFRSDCGERQASAPKRLVVSLRGTREI